MPETENNIQQCQVVTPLHCSKFMPAHPIYSCQFDGNGGIIEINDDTEATRRNPCWVHFDYLNQDNIDWLSATSILPEIAKNGLLEKKQPAKVIRLDKGILVILKAVNIKENALPDPIVTLRFYITDNLIISTRHKSIDATAAIRELFQHQAGPVDVADWLINVSDILTDQAGSAVESCHSSVIKLEEMVLAQRSVPHKDIVRVRRKLILLRRLLSPQRDTFTKIASERLTWVDENDRRHLYDVVTRLSYYIEDIDTCLLRISSVMDQINTILTEMMNKRIYLMSLFAMIFMPITFLASLFGMNLAGIPFNKASWAFGGFTFALIGLSIVFVLWLKSKKWF